MSKNDPFLVVTYGGHISLDEEVYYNDYLLEFCHLEMLECETGDLTEDPF